MLDTKILSQDIKEAIIQKNGWETLTAPDARIAQLTPAQAFDDYCVWYGIIRWSSRLTSVIENIRKAEIHTSVAALNPQPGDPRMALTLRDMILEPAAARDPFKASELSEEQKAQRKLADGS